MMKKLPLTALAGALALLVAGQSMAEAPVAELKVTGMLEVPGCDVTVDGADAVSAPAEYDAGTITPDQIKPGAGTTALPDIEKIWTISCTGKTYLTFQARDEKDQTPTVNTNTAYGLGNVNNDGKLGYYEIWMSNGEVDVENTGTFTASNVFYAAGTSIYGGAATWVYNQKLNYKMGWSNTSGAMNAAHVFRAKLTVKPTLAGTTAMKGPVTDNTSLDGLATLTFSFGLQ